jgi:putative thioredoxin
MTFIAPIDPDSVDYIFDVQLEDFDDLVLKKSHRRPVLVDFWAEWCSPCLMLAPVLYRVLGEYDGNVLLAKCEVDEGENMKLAGRHRVRGFPTVVLFEKGEPVAHFSGVRTQHQIEEFIEEHCSLLAD